MSQIIMDVREKDEFDAEHIEHSIHVPLSRIAALAPGMLDRMTERDVIIMCRGGNRAKLAAQQLAQLGYSDKVRFTVFEGGILEWKRLGRPTLVTKSSHLPIMRQVQLVAGLGVFLSTVLGVFVNPWFLAVTAFFGAGLSVAGATGFCGMAHLLAWMPWNRSAPSVREELCNTSPGSCSQQGERS